MYHHARTAPSLSCESNPSPSLDSVTVIDQSRERCNAFGLSPTMRPDYCVLPPVELARKIEQGQLLYSHALPVMETLFGQIVNTHSMVVLTDAEGLILHSLGDDDFLERAQRVALRPGALWSEAQQGTNAIGTALAEREPTTVHGDQHYLQANRFLTCSSVPIVDPYGLLIGALDVSGDHRSFHRHTMALVMMSAQMIENHLFTTTFTEALRVHFHSRPEFLGTLMEGIIAFTADGRFLSANRSAQFQLSLPLAGLRAHTLSSLFNLSSAELIDQARVSADRHLTLELHSGVGVFATVELRRRNVQVGARVLASEHAAAGAQAGPGGQVTAGTGYAERLAAKPSGLARLDSGDPQVSAVIAKIRKVIGRDIPLMIAGETGTGKEMLAHATHTDSPRKHGPFVAVNCASIPETLIESELFGYEEGAFSGARKKGAIGKLLQANGGTLFLDEIGDMPHSLQVRLLRVLQERVVNPLGSTKSIPVDVSIVCATHRDLREMIGRGQFREDLYYRLNGLVVKLPPLRERVDLATIITTMLHTEQFAGRPLDVAPDVMQLLLRCQWPGNFRQLNNVLRTASVMVDDTDTVIQRCHLPDDLLDDIRSAPLDVASSAPQPAKVPASWGRGGGKLQDLTISAIASALAEHRGNVSATARALGVSRNTIYRKMPAAEKGTLDGLPVGT